jgi:hypothetical protein
MNEEEKNLIVGMLFSFLAGLAAAAVWKFATSKKEPDESED